MELTRRLRHFLNSIRTIFCFCWYSLFVFCTTRGSVSAVVEIGKDEIDSEFDSRLARTYDKMAPTTMASQTPRPSPSVFVFINNATAYRCHICRAAITQVISAIREFMNRDFLANRRESRNQCSLESRPVRGLILKTKVFGAHLARG
jgi:hypothetical protein